MKKIQKNLFLYILILIVLIAGFILFKKYKNPDYQLVEAKVQNLEKITEITGKVVPASEIDLSFESRGTIRALYKSSGQSVKAGEVLAEIDSSEVVGEIDEAIALLRSENAKLTEIVGDGVENSKIEVAKNNLIKTINKAYINTDDTIRNKIDPFFERPNSRFPEFSMTLSDYFVRKDLNNKRYEIESLLVSWKSSLTTLNTDNLNYSVVEQNIKNLKQVESFVSIITDNAYDFEPVGDVTQAQIDAFLSGVGQGRALLASDILEINNSYQSLRNIESDVPVQKAKIGSYEATVNKLKSKAGKYLIIAPFDGIITKKYAEVGQVVESSEAIYSVISNLPLQVESFIPEINIVGVNVGDKVKINFDAFGDGAIFEGVISEVEPRETVKDGIITYKVLVDLLNENKDLKPGMSANLKIIKEIISGQIIIPSFTITKENNESFVEVLQNGKSSKKQIKILDTDNRGNYSVEGINSGEQIVIPIK